MNQDATDEMSDILQNDEGYYNDTISIVERSARVQEAAHELQAYARDMGIEDSYVSLEDYPDIDWEEIARDIDSGSANPFGEDGWRDYA